MKTIIIDGIEYNLTPKVLFKKGDFVVIQETTYQITEVENLNVTLSLNGRECLFDIDVLKNARLWDITKDAKDGDVLFTTCNNTNEIVFIYHGIEFDASNCYFLYSNTKNEYKTFNAVCSVKTDIYPATKEQRDTLFSKMKEAGYEWDADKKELKKIEQKSVEWSEKDEKIIETMCKEGDLRPSQMIWLKSLKDRVQPQWKPTNKQMEDLKYAINMVDKCCEDSLQSLYNELKKL